MIEAFASPKAYVDYLTSVRLTKGSVFCSSFLPSCLFPKHAIDYYYDRLQRSPVHRSLSEALWRFGRKVRRSLAEGSLHLIIERRALHAFLLHGHVHEASPLMEVGFNIRLEVASQLKILAQAKALSIVPAPLPYVFSMFPPDTLLLDVRFNTIDQLIQGIRIQHEASFRAFQRETERLKDEALPTSDVLSILSLAAEALDGGEPFSWPL